MSDKKTKLELTWIGKDNRPRLEPRILLEDAGLSHVAPHRVRDHDCFDNLLVHGDNLLALRSLEQEYVGRVKCVYIDPPFNTQQAFEHYDDGVAHSVWLSLMRDRLEILHRLLAPEGSLFIHIDDNELAYLIAVADEIFGRKNRVAVVTFKQSSASGPKAVNPGLVNTSNFLLYYVKDKSKWRPGRAYIPITRDERYSSYIENHEDDCSEWRLVPLRAAFAARHGLATRELAGRFGDELESKLEEFVLSAPARVVQLARVQPKDVNAEARAMLLRSEEEPGVVQRAPREGKDDYYFLNGKQVLFYSSKTRLIDGQHVTGEPASSIWDDLLSNNIHKEGGVYFPNGKKPEALIKRVLELSTLPGDIVLDSFAGSGTTGAAAHKMGRRWIMVELGEHATTHVLPRMKAVVDGGDESGITSAVGWKGGGGFRFCRLAPSLLARDKWGNYVISESYRKGPDAGARLAEAMCKLEGFTYAPSPTTFWIHGTSTERDFIYVTTQTLTHEQLAAISEEVGADRSLLICCGAFVGKPEQLANLTVKKIPAAVLSRCEWGKDDYSLNVAAVTGEDLGDATSPATPVEEGSPKRRKKPVSVQEMSLFSAPRGAK